MLRFFALGARITRVRLVAGLAIALLPAWAALLLLRSGTAPAMIAAGAIVGATVAKLLVESVRRRHDADLGGAAAVALLAGGTAVLSLASVVALGTDRLYLPQLALGTVALAWAALLLRPGSVAANRYAPRPPRAFLPAFGNGRRRSGPLAAAALTLCGAGLGYAGNAWLDGMRRHHEAVQINLAAEAHTGDQAEPDALERAYRDQNRR